MKKRPKASNKGGLGHDSCTPEICVDILVCRGRRQSLRAARLFVAALVVEPRPSARCVNVVVVVVVGTR